VTQGQPPLARSTIGRYRLGHSLGQGGMGVVYSAEDPTLGRSVAIKMIHRDTRDVQGRERLRREARLLASVNHPNICQVYEIGEEQDDLYIVMERLEGEPLADRIARSPLPLDEAMSVGLGILAALSALHERGIVHRDLKPTNVHLTPHGVKLLDFGLARTPEPIAGTTEATLTAVGMLIGTPRYMAPEQWNGQPAGPAADLFAAGALLYEILTGQPAFSGGSAVEIYHSIVYDRPPSLSGGPAVAGVDRVIQRALSKQPDARHSSAQAMSAELRAAIGRTGDVAVSRVRAVTRLIVLPFRLLRPDPEIDFLCFSLPDAITSSLSGLESLVMRSSATAARFEGAAPDLKALAQEAEVDAALMGTLLRAGDRVRVVTQLVEAPSGTLRWSKTAQVALTDLFDLQDELTRQIVESLAIPLSAREQRRLRSDVPANAHAYELYLRANQLGRATEQLVLARDLYLKCLAEDPQFAPAWARLGRVHRVIAKYDLTDDDNSVELAEQAFRKALELSPDLPLAHNLYTPFELEHLGRGRDAMRRLLERARTSAADPDLFAGLVFTCRYCGLLDASIAADRRARRLDPAIPTSVAYTYLVRGEPDKALQREDVDPYFLRLYALTVAGREAEALARCREIEAELGHRAIGNLAASVRLAIEGAGEACVTTFMNTLTRGFRDPEGFYYGARSFARAGRPDDAVAMIRRAVEGGFIAPLPVATDPWLASVRDSPELARVMADAAAQREIAFAEFKRAGGEEVLPVAAG
jgi:serine/threonine protein kinase